MKGGKSINCLYDDVSESTTVALNDSKWTEKRSWPN